MKIQILLLSIIFTTAFAVTIPTGCQESCNCNNECNVCTASGIPVLCLKGSNHEMGQFYGGIFQAELHDVINILKQYFEGQKITWDWVQKDAANFTKRWSFEYVSFLQGIADATDFTVEDIFIINGGSPIYGDSFLTKSQCMFGFVPPTRSETGQSIVVRNFDLDAPFDKISQHLAVTTLVAPNLVPTTFVSMVGQIYCQTCWNKDGVFLELNNGMPSGGFQRNYDRQDLLINLLYMVQNSNNLDRLSQQLMATTSDFSLILNVANASIARSYEMGSISFWGTKPVYPVEGNVFVSTNFFLNPEWRTYQQESWHYVYVPDDKGTWYGVTRRDNMMHLLGQRMQSVGTLKTSMDVLLGLDHVHGRNQGGANWYQTVYQVIWDPATNGVYVRRTKYDTEWTHVSLDQYYN